jgi:hypothetical protein
MIRKDISTSQKFASLSERARLLFVMILPHLDGYGKLNGSAHYIKGAVVPLFEEYTVQVIETCLREISDKTNIKWFQHKCLDYLHAINWAEHQQLRRLAPDRLPNWTPENSGRTPAPVPPASEDIQKNVTELLPQDSEGIQKNVTELLPPASEDIQKNVTELLPQDSEGIQKNVTELLPPEVEVEIEIEREEEEILSAKTDVTPADASSADADPPASAVDEIEGTETEFDKTDMILTGTPKQREEPLKLLLLWNRYAEESNLVKAVSLTDNRRRKAQVRLRERALEEWDVIFRMCAETPFLNGQNNGGWKADFDWIIKTTENAEKVLNGKYVGNAGNDKKKGDKPWDQYRK